MIDAVLEDIIGVAEAPPALADGYAAQADWDPRTADGYVYIVLRPQRIQAKGCQRTQRSDIDARRSLGRLECRSAPQPLNAA